MSTLEERPRGVAAAADIPVLQRRTVRVLAAAQVLGGSGVGIGLAVGSLMLQELSGSAAIAGLASTASVLGGALAAVPLARLSAQAGRRRGISLGFALGAAGATIVVIAALLGVALLALLGMLLVGGAAAAGFQSRFAATDLAAPERRAAALSTVMWATTVGSVLGPNFAEPAGRLVGPLNVTPLAGPFVVSAAAFVGATVLLTLALRPDPLLLAGALRAGDNPTREVSLAAAFSTITRAPLALLGFTAVVVGHAVMVGVMAMTPVHMSASGSGLRVIGVVISGHIAGMYALSPVVGWLADRLGRVAVVLLGAGILLTSLVLAGTAGPHGASQLGVALFLLGLGWSCGMIAGSTLVTEAVPEPERAGVQGASDFGMQLAGATGGALAGLVVSAAGYSMLTAVAALLLVPVVVLAVPQAVRVRAG